MRVWLGIWTSLIFGLSCSTAMAEVQKVNQFVIGTVTGTVADGGVAAGAVQAAGGNASATIVAPLSSLQHSVSQSLATLNSAQPSVTQYTAVAGNKVGGAVSTVLLAPQTTSDNQMQIQPSSSITPGVYVSTANGGLPAGTYISGVGTQAGVTTTQTTSATTMTDSEQQAQLNASTTGLLTGMSNQLVFASVFVVPVGTTISGTNIPSGTTVVGSVVNGSTQTVYMSANVTTDVVSGTSVTFTYQSTTVYLSNKWTIAPTAGIGIGLYVQDDQPAFQNAAFWSAPERGGLGGRIIIPSGTYFLSASVNTYNEASFQLGAGVTFIPGSASIDAVDGSFPAASDASFIGGGRNQTPTEVNISQVLQQRLQPDLQGQALLINQNNASCTNDGSGRGCGMVGIEVKQSHNSNITNGVLYEYHGTDTVYSGQTVTWAGVEAELLNNSGVDVIWDGRKGEKTGLHIDDLGNTNNTVALEPGGGASTGKWHRGLDCATAGIVDWCWDTQTTPIATDGTPTMLAGATMSGALLGQSLYIGTPGTGNVLPTSAPFTVAATSGNVNTLGTITAAGTIKAPAVTTTGFINSVGLSNQGAVGIFSDGVYADPQSGTARALKVSGSGIAYTGGMYGDTITVTGANIVGGFIPLTGNQILTASQCGQTLKSTDTVAVIYTVPAGLTVGCKIAVVQDGVSASSAIGNVTVVGASGETIKNFGGTVTAGQYAGLLVKADTTTSAYVLAGN